MADCEEIDEAEEEALLKSDDEHDLSKKGSAKKEQLSGLVPPTEDTEDSLVNEATASDQSNAPMNISNESESDDDSEQTKSARDYTELLQKIEKEKYVYDHYVKLCDLSHKTGELQDIRKAYNLFARVYPLSTDLWLKYLHVELSLAVSPEEIKRMITLYRTALKDYYSIEIALEFAKFAKKTTRFERIWQELLDVYGCHFLEGQKFFKLYRKELAEEKGKNAVQKYIIKSFLKELKLPLNNMEESYIELKVFCEKNKNDFSTSKIDWNLIDKDYYKAKYEAEKMVIFEAELASLDVENYQERAGVYQRYVKEVDDFLDENILQTLYERMVADCCLNPTVWQTYIDFIEERDFPEQIYNIPIFKQTTLDICERALRNCPWSEQLYITLMQLKEKMGASRTELQEVLERTYEVGFQTPEPMVAIWMEHLTCLHRRTNYSVEKEREILRSNFELAWEILGKYYGDLADCNCEILKFLARLEYGPLNEPERGKKLWNLIMQSSDNDTKSGLWIEYAELEVRHDVHEARKVYRAALNKVDLDNPSVILSSWERFERCHGDIDSVKICQKECAQYIASYNCKNFVHPSEVAENTKQYTRKRKSHQQNDEHFEPKKPKKQQQPQGETSKNENPKKHPSEEQTEEPNPCGRQRLSGVGTHVQFMEHTEIDYTKDHLRIFLSNLDYGLSEEDIRTNLPEINIEKIDLVCSPNGRSRGFAYVQLANEAEVEKALALDRRILKDRPLYISSVLRDKEKRQKVKYSDGLEPKKVFVKNLPNDATKEEFEEIFSKYGKLQAVRLVHHKNGKFRNMAYIEFEDEADANKAVVGLEKTELRGHTLTVAISQPPPRPSKPSKSTNASSDTLKSLGVGTKRSKTEQKPRMSMIPAVVRKQLEKKDGASDLMPPPPTQPTANGTKAASKTNEDFRKLLEK